MNFYILITVMSLLSSLLTLPLECMARDIEKLKRGAKPDSASALFPLIPCSQLFHLWVMWQGNYLMPNAGFIAVSVYIFFAVAFKIYWYTKYRAELKRLGYVWPPAGH